MLEWCWADLFGQCKVNGDLVMWGGSTLQGLGDRCPDAKLLPSGAGGLDVRDWEPKTFSTIKAVTPAKL